MKTYTILSGDTDLYDTQVLIKAENAAHASVQLLHDLGFTPACVDGNFGWYNIHTGYFYILKEVK